MNPITSQILAEACGRQVYVETQGRDSYQGKLIDAEESMNLTLSSVEVKSVVALNWFR